MSDLAMLERLSNEGRSVLVNSQINMISECIDLCRNGYMIRFHVFGTTYWFVSLKHSTNGRQIAAIWHPDNWVLKEGSRILKSVSYKVGE